MSATATASHVPTQDERFHVRFLWAVTLLSGAVLWLRPIASSFWEDELVTWWVIDGSFREMLHRSYAFQGQTALYYPVAWLVRQIGDKEWVLRLPSLIAIVIAAFLLFRLATRLLDREFGQTRGAGVRLVARYRVRSNERTSVCDRDARHGRVRVRLGHVAGSRVARRHGGVDRGDGAAGVRTHRVRAGVASRARVCRSHGDGMARPEYRRPRSSRDRHRCGARSGPRAAGAGIFGRRALLVLPTSLSFDWFASLIVPAFFVSAR